MKCLDSEICIFKILLTEHRFLSQILIQVLRGQDQNRCRLPTCIFAVAKGQLSSLTNILWKTTFLHGYITALPKGCNQEKVSLNVVSDELNIAL